MNIKWLVLGLCCLTIGVANIAEAQETLGNYTGDALFEGLKLDGKSSVIVEYHQQPAGLSSLALVAGEARIPVIQSMHQQFMGSLPDTMDGAITGVFSYVPGVTMLVTDDQLQEIRNNPHVKQVYPNRMYKASLEESIDLVLPSGSKDKYSGKGQTIAVIDTGVDRSHPFFKVDGASRMIDGGCYSGAGVTLDDRVVTLCPNRSTEQVGAAAGVDCTRFSFPGCDHGTHVAGIAAGNEGVANEANIIGIQVFTGLRDVFRQNICGDGRGVDCVRASNADLLKGLERVFALRNTYNIAAVNMSLGGGRFTSTCDGNNPMLTNIINQLKSAGIATVASSGNGGSTSAIGSPACISNVVAVGATSDFTGSIFGRPVTLDQRTFYSDSGSALDLYAPGTLIRSSVPGNAFANFNGTSMASPHVAGAFAVIKSRANALSVAEIESTLKSVGPIVSQSGVNRRRIDIVEALKKLGLFNSVPITPILQLLMLDSSE